MELFGCLALTSFPMLLHPIRMLRDVGGVILPFIQHMPYASFFHLVASHPGHTIATDEAVTSAFMRGPR